MGLSIIVPSYKDESLLSSFLDSIKDQSNQNFELILIVDSPTQKILKIIEKFRRSISKRLKLIVNSKRQYMKKLIWKGIENSKYKYVTFISTLCTLDKLYVERILMKINDGLPDIIELSFFFKNMKRHYKSNLPIVTDLQKQSEVINDVMPFIFNKVFSIDIFNDNKESFIPKLNDDSIFSIFELMIFLQIAKTIISIKEELFFIELKKDFSINTLQIAKSWRELLTKKNLEDNHNLFLIMSYCAFRHIAMDLMELIILSNNIEQFDKHYNQIMKIISMEKYQNLFKTNKYILEPSKINSFLLSVPKKNDYIKRLKDIR